MSGTEKTGRGRSAGSRKNWFGKGVCPNPGGRPKGRQSIRECFEKLLDQEIEAGAERHTKREFLAKRLLNEIFQDPDFAMRFLRWLEGDRPAPAYAGTSEDGGDEGEAEDEEIIAKALERKSRMQASAESQAQSRVRKRKRR